MLKQVSSAIGGVVFGMLVVLIGVSLTKDDATSTSPIEFRPARVGMAMDSSPHGVRSGELETMRAEINALREQIESSPSDRAKPKTEVEQRPKVSDEQRRTALDDHFEASQPDWDWATDTEEAIHVSLQKIAGAQVLDAECRAISCRAAVKFGSAESRDAFVQGAFEGPWRSEFAEFPVQTDSGLEYRYYVMREGHALGEVFMGRP